MKTLNWIKRNRALALVSCVAAILVIIIVALAAGYARAQGGMANISADWVDGELVYTNKADGTILGKITTSGFTTRQYVEVATASTTRVLLASESGGIFQNASGALKIYDLPAAAAGLHYYFETNDPYNAQCEVNPTSTNNFTGQADELAFVLNTSTGTAALAHVVAIYNSSTSEYEWTLLHDTSISTTGVASARSSTYCTGQ